MLKMTPFKLNLGDSEFRDRQNKIFDQLKILENNRKNLSINENDKTSTNVKAQKNETRHFRGKESIFKKPQKTAPKNYILRTPDFKKNPHKWTKYSLEDVEEITEESNRKSAMDFLKDLAKRKKLEQGIIGQETMEELPSKIVFNKHIKDFNKGKMSETNEKELSSTISSDDKGIFSNSKLIMPEYVIGQKPTKKDKNLKKAKVEKGKELKLDHLMFEDE